MAISARMLIVILVAIALSPSRGQGNAYDVVVYGGTSAGTGSLDIPVTEDDIIEEVEEGEEATIEKKEGGFLLQ